jgi:hypothetical protein
MTWWGWLLVAVGGYAIVLLFAIALCRAAADGDRRLP